MHIAKAVSYTHLGINSKNKNQVQCYAESSDGINFTKDFENPLLKETLCSASNEDFRDPQVWRHGDYWYLIAGSAENDYGCVLLYRSCLLYTSLFAKRNQRHHLILKKISGKISITEL